MPAEYKNNANPILLDSGKRNEHIDLLLCNIFCYGNRFVTGDVLLRRRFVTGDVLLRRRFVEETFCYGDVLLGDVLSRRRFEMRRFVCASKNVLFEQRT
jgi:hypothetical protein